jgi:hypothetical protein
MFKTRGLPAIRPYILPDRKMAIMSQIPRKVAMVYPERPGRDVKDTVRSPRRFGISAEFLGIGHEIDHGNDDQCKKGRDGDAENQRPGES